MASDHLLGGQVGEETSDEEGSGGNSSVLSSLLRTHPEAAGVIKSAEKYIPFILIIAAKCFFDHATGKPSKSSVFLSQHWAIKYDQKSQSNLLSG